MNKDGLNKLRAHVDKMIDLFMEILAQHELVRPIQRDAQLIAKLSEGERGAGFMNLRHALYWNLVLQITKIISDASSPNVPSLKNIIGQMQLSGTRDLLRAKYIAEHQSVWPVDDRAIFGAQFDEHFARMMRRSQALLDSPTVESYQIVRDRLLAHYQINYADGTYKLTEISEFGLKYGDERKLIDELHAIIPDLNSLVRSASFNLLEFETDVRDEARSFWYGTP